MTFTIFRVLGSTRTVSGIDVRSVVALTLDSDVVMPMVSVSGSANNNNRAPMVMPAAVVIENDGIMSAMMKVITFIHGRHVFMMVPVVAHNDNIAFRGLSYSGHGHEERQGTYDHLVHLKYLHLLPISLLSKINGEIIRCYRVKGNNRIKISCPE